MKNSPDWLSVRLNEEDSQVLTALRATYEIQTMDRVTMKQLVRNLIFDALGRKRRGELELPMVKTRPVIARGCENERLNLDKTADEHAALNELATTRAGTAVTYAHADVVRELIHLYGERCREVQGRIRSMTAGATPLVAMPTEESPL